MILSFLSLASLALAQVQLPSPVTSVDVSLVKGGPEGLFIELWQADICISLESTESIQPGDFFNLLFEGAPLTPRNYDFDVVDSSGNVIFHVANSDQQWDLTATASDYFLVSTSGLEGSFFVEFELDERAATLSAFDLSVAGVSGSATLSNIDEFNATPDSLSASILPDVRFIFVFPIEAGEIFYSAAITTGEGLAIQTDAYVSLQVVVRETQEIVADVTGEVVSESLLQITPFGPYTEESAFGYFVLDARIVAGIETVSEYCATISRNGIDRVTLCNPAGKGVLGAPGGSGLVDAVVDTTTSAVTSAETTAVETSVETSAESSVETTEINETTTVAQTTVITVDAQTSAETTAPETSAETSTGAVETSVETNVPETSAIETNVPETSAIETSAPETSAESTAETSAAESTEAASATSLDVSVSAEATSVEASATDTSITITAPSTAVTPISADSNSTVTVLESTTITTTQTVTYCKHRTCGHTAVTLTTIVPIVHTVTTCPTVIEGVTVTVVVPCEIEAATTTAETAETAWNKTHIVPTATDVTVTEIIHPTVTEIVHPDTTVHPDTAHPDTSAVHLTTETLVEGDSTLTLTRTVIGTIILDTDATATPRANETVFQATNSVTIHQANSGTTLKAGALLLLSFVVMMV